MRNKIDLTTDPDALFLNPWKEEGVKLLEQPEFIMRERSAARIDGFAVSAYPQINAKIRAFVAATKKQKQFPHSYEFNTVPVVLESVGFRKSHVSVADKMVLSGASSTRLINGYRRENADDDDANDALNTYFSDCRSENNGRRLTVENTFVEPDLDFAVTCRNTFNFFHFITESLSQLCALDTVGFRGNIYFHFPNQEDKHRSFADAFVDALFPEYSGRVFFERAPKEYDLVLSSYDLIGAVPQMPEANLKALRQVMQDENAVGLVEFQPTLAMNSVTSGVLGLRARGVRAISDRDFGHLPKRFFVGRSEEHSRSRPLGGEDKLMRQLAALGFDYVVFEDLEPLEQVALMAGAEVMISHHGAGFANMMFAPSSAYVIELGTLQTAQYRWADFWPIAHAAQCTYINFFADFSHENPLQEPNFATDGIVPTNLSESAIAQIVSFVYGLLGGGPKIGHVQNVVVLGRRLLRAGAAEQAMALLDQHSAMIEGSLDLCLLRADCHKAFDEPKSELLALEEAFRADTKRWQTLIRIIWCANRCDRPQVIRWALSRLALDFPERHEAFVSNHDWVRFVA